MENSRVFYPCNPYDEQGVDITLIKQMLALPPIERLRHMERRARETKALWEYGRKHREARAACGASLKIENHRL
jgi:hypothetical protein